MEEEIDNAARFVMPVTKREVRIVQVVRYKPNNTHAVQDSFFFKQFQEGETVIHYYSTNNIKPSILNGYMFYSKPKTIQEFLTKLKIENPQPYTE